MTKREAAIVSAYTGFLIGDFSEVHKYAEEILDRPVVNAEFGSATFMSRLRDACKEDFVNIPVE